MKKKLELKYCPECEAALIPYGDTWLHDEGSNCRLVEYLDVKVEVTEPYERALGKLDQEGVHFIDVVWFIEDKQRSYVDKFFRWIKLRFNEN